MDEKQARHLLAEMQSRLARSSYDALEIPAGTPGPEQVRAAFFRLTKTFHPLKFAQMAPDVQKLANEVFLSLRAAHDSLARPAKQPNRTGSMPALQKAEARPPTPTSGSRPLDRPGAAVAKPAVTPASSSSTQMPAQRPPMAPATRLTPPGGAPIQTASSDAELAGIEDLLQKQQWDAARKRLDALIAKDPKPRYKALVQYSFGREAQLARKVDEARDKLLDALEIDKDLLLAQKALAELHTRRK